MSACEYLKCATTEQHRQVEGVLVNRLLFSSTLSLERYAHCLSRYLSLVYPLELRLATHEQPLTCGYTMRCQLLRADLLALGWSQQQIDSVAPCDHLPIINTAAEALGAAYVLQGSQSGSVIIRRRVLTTLGEEALHQGGLSFWGNVDKAATAKLWRDFKLRMDVWFAPPYNFPLEQAVAAAQQTFAAFSYGLNLP